ncbi:DUF4870 domain-containing protein [Agromyces arachidis]|uniref:DUF4870 domain-containing protein n=1 Tax=Agromyces arachidis TaxID=766966 RepID=UPI0040577CBF
MSPPDQRLWATLIHIGGAIFAFWPSLIGYLVLKDRGAFVRNHSATALNFQLTMLIAEVVGWILSVTVILAVIGVPLLVAVYIVRIVFSIIAAVTANKGEPYTYPLAIKFVS